MSGRGAVGAAVYPKDLTPAFVFVFLTACGARDLEAQAWDSLRKSAEAAGISFSGVYDGEGFANVAGTHWGQS